jgi:hypothetical protein
VINKSVYERSKYWGVTLRGETKDQPHCQEAAIKYYKNVCKMADRFEVSGEPADVVTSAAMLNCWKSRIGIQTKLHMYFSSLHSGKSSLEGWTEEEWDKGMDSGEVVLALLEKDIQEAILLNLVKLRTERITDASNP